MFVSLVFWLLGLCCLLILCIGCLGCFLFFSFGLVFLIRFVICGLFGWLWIWLFCFALLRFVLVKCCGLLVCGLLLCTSVYLIFVLLLTSEFCCLLWLCRLCVVCCFCVLVFAIVDGWLGTVWCVCLDGVVVVLDFLFDSWVCVSVAYLCGLF